MNDVHITVVDLEKDFDCFEESLKKYNDEGGFLYTDFLNFQIIPSATYICLIYCLKQLTIDKKFSERENFDLIIYHGAHLCGLGVGDNIQSIWNFFLEDNPIIETELLLESYIPLLSMNSFAIEETTKLKYSIKKLNLRKYDFSTNKKSQHIYHFLCKLLDLQYVKEAFLFLNSHNPFDDNLKNISNNELEEHIIQIKEVLKNIWIVNSDYCSELFGKDLISLTMIESTVLIKEIYLENLENSINENEKNEAELILLVILIHECAHIKRKMNYNYIYYRSPKKLDSRLYLNNHNYGESGFWLEEHLFGCLLNINKIEGNSNEKIKQLLLFENWERPEKIKEYCKSLLENFTPFERFVIGNLIGKRNPKSEERGHFATLSQARMFAVYEAFIKNKNCKQ